MGKRKETAREKREKILAQKQAKYQQKEKERNEEAQKRLEEQRKEAEKKEIQALIQSLNPDDIDTKKKKSSAKAVGLKSTFILNDDKLLMTSFGAGNKALCEKYIENDVVTDAREDAVLSVTKTEKLFNIKGRLAENAQTDNPLYSKNNPRHDMIYCKEKLERIYFNKKFDDNIHIQLIYNILDIEKILATHINNIVYTLDNVLRRTGSEHDDFIGYMGLNCDYKNFKTNDGKKDKEMYELFSKLIRQPQMAYFGDTFLPYDKEGKKLQGKAFEEYEEKCFYLFSVLGMMRQATAHGAKNLRENLFNLEEILGNTNEKPYRRKAREALNDIYDQRIQRLNKNFLDLAKKDLYILMKIIGADTQESKEALIKEYYRFVVLKNYKYLGFSIKHLREWMIKQDPEQCISDEQYDTVRQKLNRVLDFLIYRYYQSEENLKEAQNIVEHLRSAQSGYDKEYIYGKEAKKLWGILEDDIKVKVLPKMDGEYIKDIEAEDFDSEMIEDVKITDDVSIFSKMIYLLTLFLDGKEINDLLTQLVNKFDNIASFIEILNHEGLYCKFNVKYSLFLKSAEITEELKCINSFARMTEVEPTAKKIMFIEAAEVLGYDENHGKLKDYIENILNKGKGDGKKEKNKNGFRNFIINNVLESDRFKYLVRYGNPSKIKKYAENEKVVSFVLKDIPDKQICAYYNSCNGTKKEYFTQMRDDLAERIQNLQFTDFENVYNDKTKDIDKINDKERKKNIIRLYLTVLYLVQKNLIYINSRYFLAFHCVERDEIISYGKTVRDPEKSEEWCAFAKDFLQKHPLNARAMKYMEKNFENSNQWSIHKYRNCVAHLNAVRNASDYISDVKKFDSYFELYHYLVQRALINQFEYESKNKSQRNSEETIISGEKVLAEGKLSTYFECVKKYDSYCKDFVKALNVPFAYNLARYKNLSINELFDRNNYLPEKGKNIGPEDNE